MIEAKEKLNASLNTSQSLNGNINVGGSSYKLPIASETTLGGIKVGNNLTIEEDGTLNASGGSGGIIEGDTVPINAIFEYEGDLVPEGYEEVPKKPSDDNSLYYKEGDTYVILENAYIEVCGCVTSSKKQIRFALFTPKFLENIKKITVEYAKITVRYHLGGYLLNMIDVTSNIVAESEGENVVYLCYKPDTEINSTNNIPVSVEINGLNLTFHESMEV